MTKNLPKTTSVSGDHTMDHTTMLSDVVWWKKGVDQAATA
jgi:hypothetical protein